MTGGALARSLNLDATALIIDDERDIRELIAMSLERVGVVTHTAANLAEARNLLSHYPFDVCLTDMRLPDGDGVSFVRELQESYPALPCAVITAHGNMDAAVEAMKNGAFDFVSKPVDLTVLRRLVSQAVASGRSAVASTDASLPPATIGCGLADTEVPALSTAPSPGSSPLDDAESPGTLSVGDDLVDGQLLVGSSPILTDLRSMIVKVARTNAPIWITGESGTGKELIARLIHANSVRADGPFVAVNCGAVPGELMESEFFGHRKGSFTGAHSDHPGLFRSAEGGTLLLDEIAELPASMQVKLLRAIQERRVRSIGDSEEKPVDTRILSASHVDLADAVDRGTFRQDLYYRLNVISVRSPALRERAEDIPLLIEHILKKQLEISSHSERSDPVSVAPEAMAALERYRFDGNIRELENILERAAALCTDGVIRRGDLQLNQCAGPSDVAMATETRTGSARKVLKPADPASDREDILMALNDARWNRRKAARNLGLTYRQLRYRIQLLGLADDSDEAA